MIILGVERVSGVEISVVVVVVGCGGGLVCGGVWGVGGGWWGGGLGGWGGGGWGGGR